MKKSPLLPLLVWILVFPLLSSCDRQGGVEVKGISGITIDGLHQGALSMKVALMIHNGTKHKVVVRKLVATVYYGETEGGEITVTDKISMPARSEKTYTVPVEMTISNVGNLLKAFVVSAAHGQKKELHIRGMLKVRSGILYKKIPFDEKQVIGAH